MDIENRNTREMPGLAISNPAAQWEDKVVECRVFDSVLFRVGAQMRHGFIHCGEGRQAILRELSRYFYLPNDEVPVIYDWLKELLEAHSWETFGEPEARMAFVAELARRLSTRGNIKETIRPTPQKDG